jgi:hypothetical protein
MWRAVTSGVVAVGAAVLVAFAVIPRAPAVEAGENGTFANDCCGTLELSGGKMVLNEQRTVLYTVAEDGDGPYILPRMDVGTMPDHGFAVDGTRSVRKLRLDRLPNPTRITLYEGLIPYIFKTQAQRIRN